MAGISNPGLLGRVVNALQGKLGSKDMPDNAAGRIARLGMTERQQELNYLWGVYRNMQYASRKLDWNGRESTDRLTTDVISSQGYLPPGFQDMSAQAPKAFPLKYRRPTAPYSLIKVIVDRFTGLLFSENQHPEIKLDGDPVSEDWLRAVAEVSRLWQQMIQARQYGGAMGSVAVGFQFVEGRPVVEVHDPRWLFPEFVEHGSNILLSLEKRYKYTKEVQEESTGKWEQKEFWYRRILNQTSDVLYAPAPVEKGEEPEWVVAKQADHNFGFVPAVWVQNLPLQDAEDGDPDCPPAVYDNVEGVDALIAQAYRGILANCDPTLIITSKAEMTDVKVGSDNALRVPDGDAKFLELQASGPKAAMEMADQLRKHILEMAQCVLEHPDVAGKTATEVERMYQSMLSKADVLREQYGQKAVVPLLEMIYRAAQQVALPRAVPQLPQQAGPAGVNPEAPQPVDPSSSQPPSSPTPGLSQIGSVGALQQTVQALGGTGQGQDLTDGAVGSAQVATVTKGSVVLPPKYEKQPDGSITATPRELGTGGTINLKWPGYFQPSLTDVQLAATAAAAAMQGGLIDDETAIGFVAPFFKVEDKVGLVEKVRAHAAGQQADLMAQMAGANPMQPDPMANLGEPVPEADEASAF